MPRSFIKYKINIEIKDGKLMATRCNCTFCQKLRSTNLSIAKPEENFTLLSPSSRSEMGDYAPNVKSVHRYFCKECGAHVFMEGYYEVQGNKHDLFMVNACTIDQPQDGVDLSKMKIMYFDMLTNNMTGGLKEQPWPHGLI
jgi:hypothetical protein